MKKMILAATALALAGASVQTASAGDREWATAGKVLTGLLAAKVVTDAIRPAPVYTYQAAPTYAYQPQVVYATAPTTTVIANAPTVAPAPVVQTTTVVQPAGSVVYQTAAPVYVQPAPTVVYQPAPVYVQPAPVVVYRPAYCPPPVYYGSRVSVGFSFGGGHGHHGYHGHHGHGHHHRGGRW